jgi:hypothetical protein
MEIARYIFLVLSGAFAGWLGYLLARGVVLAVWEAATAPARPKPARPPRGKFDWSGIPELLVLAGGFVLLVWFLALITGSGLFALCAGVFISIVVFVWAS